jgi:predicted nucleotidyltransferase
MKILLEERRRRQSQEEAQRQDLLEKMPGLLGEQVPGAVVWLYGSLLVPGKFHDGSDIDLAFEYLPPGKSIYRIQSELSRSCGREVDVCLLEETRLQESIRREGVQWIV